MAIPDGLDTAHAAYLSERQVGAYTRTWVPAGPCGGRPGPARWTRTRVTTAAAAAR